MRNKWTYLAIIALTLIVSTKTDSLLTAVGLIMLYIWYAYYYDERE